MPNTDIQQRIREVRQKVGVQAPTVNSDSATSVDPIQQRIAEVRAKVGVEAPAQPQVPEPKGFRESTGDFAKEIAREIGQPIARLGANVAMSKNLAESLFTGPDGEDARRAEEIRTQGLDLPFFGNVKPVGQTGNFARDVADTVGVGTEIASTAVPLSRAPNILGRFATGQIGRGIGTGMTVGGIGGSMFGAGRETQNQAQREDGGFSLGAIAGATARDAAFGAGGGAVLGGAGAVGAKSLRFARDVRNPVGARREAVDEFLGSKQSLQNEVNRLGAQRVDIPGIVAQDDVFNAIRVKDGKLDTDGAVEVVRESTDALLDIKGQLLPRVDNLATRITREELRERALGSIDDVLPEQRRGIERRLNRQIDALGDDFTISDVDRIRARARRSARTAKGDAKSNSEFVALEKAARDIVFEKTDNLPIDADGVFAQLNDRIRQLISAEEFLSKKLNGQIVKGGRLGRMLGRVVGAVAGAKGGPLGALLGGQLGDQVSKILIDSTLSNSIKFKIIRQLTKGHPKQDAVLEAARKFLKDVENFDQFRLPALPAPAMRMPPRRGTSGVEVIPAGKGVPGRDPATGKLQRTFSSTGENLNKPSLNLRQDGLGAIPQL